MTWWGERGEGFGLLVMTTLGVVAGLVGLACVTVRHPIKVARSAWRTYRDWQ